MPAGPRPARRSAAKGSSDQRAGDAGPAPFIPGPKRPGRRLTPAYDLEGPRIRLGVAWFIVVFASLIVGRLLDGLPLVGLAYAAVAALGAVQVVTAWAGQHANLFKGFAAVIAAGVGVSASFGAAALGGALVGAAALGLLAGGIAAFFRRPMLPTTALVLQASLPSGLVGASVILTLHYEIGAAVILLAMAMAFDLGDFVIGSGAGSLVEGPIAGALMIALVGGVAAVGGAPPFHGVSVWGFAVGAMVLCPLGQVAASWLLPDATVRASGLRRLDSLLILAPVWAFATGLVVAKG